MAGLDWLEPMFIAFTPGIELRLCIRLPESEDTISDLSMRTRLCEDFISMSLRLLLPMMTTSFNVAPSLVMSGTVSCRWA